MTKLMRVNKPKTQRGRRKLLAREPHLVEEPKMTLVMQGRSTSDIVRGVLNDLHMLKKPQVTKLTKKNNVSVFEDIIPVEKLCRKFDCTLFVLGSHSKKRPNNLVIGRMFDGSLLDMIEFGITGYQGIDEFSAEKIFIGIKPCLLFSGSHWESNTDLKQAQSLFTDLFHREKCASVRFQGLEHILNFVATSEDRILIRSYRVIFKKSRSNTNSVEQESPKIDLKEIGPRINLVLRRSKLASDDLWKEALRQPKQLKKKVKKNKSSDELGTSYGRIHLGQQHVEKIQTRKMVGLKKHVTLPPSKDDANQI